jgi:hypothetical protein
MVNSMLVHYTHHMITNLVIEVEGDEATCDASAMVFSKGVLRMTTHTHDDLVRVSDKWQIRFRTYEPDPVDDADVAGSETEVAASAERMADFQRQGGWRTSDV